MEAIGRDYYPALNDLDRKMLKYLGHIRGGIFVEAGANDGLSQSNTWHLERKLGWRGLLVEPIPQVAQLCKRFRPASTVENCALGSFGQEGERLALHYGALMTVAEGASTAHMFGGSPRSHATEGASWVGERSYDFEVDVHSLSSLLTRHGFNKVDFLSLDVEGFEIPVLNGIDFSKTPINYLLIETSTAESVSACLKGTHALIDRLSEHDYLYLANRYANTEAHSCQG
jgi:FkbM family methyltransferase